MRPIDKIRNLGSIPQVDWNLFLTHIGMPNSKIRVTDAGNLEVLNPNQTAHYTFEQFIDIMIEIKSEKPDAEGMIFVNKTMLKEMIKEMLQDGTIVIQPSCEHWVKVEVIIDGEVIQTTEG